MTINVTTHEVFYTLVVSACIDYRKKKKTIEDIYNECIRYSRVWCMIFKNKKSKI